jgi:hypothetical protein
VERDAGVRRVGGKERIADPLLDGEFAIEDSEDHRAMASLLRAIHHQDVSGEDSSVSHRITLYPDKKRRRWPTHHQAVEIENLIDGALGW